MVPSFLGINPPTWLTTDLNKMGSAIDGYATSTKNYIKSLNEGRSGQSVTTKWEPGTTTTNHTSNALFGIPWLKL